MVAETEDTEDESCAIDCPVLVTERLVLRPPHQDDIPELAVLADNRRVAEMLARMPHPYGEAEARAFVQSIRSRRRSGCVYALTLADTGAFIGCAGLDARSRWPGDRLLDRRALLAARLCHRGRACAGRPRLQGNGDRCAQRLVPRHQQRVAPRHPQMRLPVCRPGHDELDLRRPGAGRALPPRPQDLGQPAQLGVS